MKRKIVLASHGGLASGLYDTAKMIVGKLPFDVEIYSLQPAAVYEFRNTAPVAAAGGSAAQLLNTAAYFPVCTDHYGSVFLCVYGMCAFHHFSASHRQRNNPTEQSLLSDSWQRLYGEGPRYLVSLRLCLVSVKQL